MGHTLLLRQLTDALMRSGSVHTIVRSATYLRLVPVAMLSCALWLGGATPALAALAGFWCGRTATLVLACARSIT
jgi:hypothetical protein